MEKTSEALLKEFTRYFVPGLVLYLLAIALPILVVLGPEALEQYQVLSIGHVVVVSAVAGYLLDSLGAYAWTPSRREYKGSLGPLAEKLRAASESSETALDPDSYLAAAWYTDAANYDRLFRERAAWVAILEASFAMALSAVVLVAACLARFGPTLSQRLVVGLTIGMLLVLLSVQTARKGVQRMHAHDKKLIELVRRNRSSGGGATS